MNFNRDVRAINKSCFVQPVPKGGEVGRIAGRNLPGDERNPGIETCASATSGHAAAAAPSAATNSRRVTREIVIGFPP